MPMLPAASTPAAAGPARPPASGGGRPPIGSAPRRPIRWRRIPGRIVLVLCFLVGAGALVVAVVPFHAVTSDGVELACGPAVYEVLMPPDPAFDDTAENVACPAPAQNRLLIAGVALAGAIVVAMVTVRRTRGGSAERDTRWLASTSTRRRP